MCFWRSPHQRMRSANDSLFCHFYATSCKMNYGVFVREGSCIPEVTTQAAASSVSVCFFAWDSLVACSFALYVTCNGPKIVFPSLARSPNSPSSPPHPARPKHAHTHAYMTDAEQGFAEPRERDGDENSKNVSRAPAALAQQLAADWRHAAGRNQKCNVTPYDSSPPFLLESRSLWLVGQCV